jgi:arachidonate 15-lipoxygenase
MAFANRVPLREQFDARYLAAMARNAADIVKNRASQPTSTWPTEDHGLAALAAKAPHEAVLEIARHLVAATGHLPEDRPTDLEGYADLIATLPKPLSLTRGGYDDDLFFAWQQVAGATPINLRGVTALPENLAVDAATFARAIGDADSLGKALGEGRVFVSDYAMFDRMPTGKTGGKARYLWAPIALFVRGADRMLHPVAIQVGQRPGAESPVMTPKDGVAWRMAKTTVTTADMNLNGVVAHFGLCHAVTEAFICVSHRRLAPSHPLLHLLVPHFEYTLAVNERARTSVVNVGGVQDTLLSGTREADFEVTNRAVAAEQWSRAGARAELAARGVDDPARLPFYPFRDDGVPLADALHRWVEGYLRIYYASDDAVVNDAEVRAWADELGRAGGFQGMPQIDGVAALARFTSDVLFRITGLHAVINYAGWDFAAWAPSMPSMGFGPGPSGGEADEAAWRAMLPALSVANGLLEMLYFLGQTRLNRLGEYPPGHFGDPRVAPALKRLQGELAAIGRDQKARDAGRPWPFPYLSPDVLTASILV